MAPIRKILIVDDEPNIRESLAALLSQEGYQAYTAADGGSALERLSQEDDIDLVLADVRMPGLDGMTLLQEIDARRIPAACVMMSAYGSADLAIQAMKQGACDYISKPFKADEVLITVKKAEERIILQRENDALRRRVTITEPDLIGSTPAMRQVVEAVEKIAPYKSTVLILGESGTGKEVVARAVHRASPRAGKPFVPINCAAIPENLLESELFGHEKGAFTGAHAAKAGLFEKAHGGTLFLDEIGELPVTLQVKLLRVLQEEEIRRLGAGRTTRIDVRVIAATSREIMKEVREGRFREDLYYRLNVFSITIPPLRDRRADIPTLVEHFLGRLRERLGLRLRGVTRSALRRLMAYHWPGNVRELENALERAALMGDSLWIKPEHLAPAIDGGKGARSLNVEEDLSIKQHVRRMEEELIRKALSVTRGNRTHAAKLLEISHRALLYKIKEYGIA